MVKKSMNFLCLLLFLIFALVVCALQKFQRGTVISPEKGFSRIEWTKEEKAQDLGVRTIRQTKQASYHLIRLKGVEKPHVHDTHDLVVFILSGNGIIHFDKHSTKIKPGDVIEIPQGEIHWGENTGSLPCELYAVFTPPFDGKDHREIKNK